METNPLDNVPYSLFLLQVIEELKKDVELCKYGYFICNHLDFNKEKYSQANRDKLRNAIQATIANYNHARPQTADWTVTLTSFVINKYNLSPSYPGNFEGRIKWLQSLHRRAFKKEMKALMDKAEIKLEKRNESLT